MWPFHVNPAGDAPTVPFAKPLVPASPDRDDDAFFRIDDDAPLWTADRTSVTPAEKKPLAAVICVPEESPAFDALVLKKLRFDPIGAS